jgi:hypothetical protein
MAIDPLPDTTRRRWIAHIVGRLLELVQKGA